MLFYFLGLTTVFTQPKAIEIEYKRNDDNSVDFTYIKHKPGSFQVVMTFSQLSNCRQGKYSAIIKAKTGRLLRLKPIDPEQPINFAYSTRTGRGTPNPKIDPELKYLLPFATGKTVSVDESTQLRAQYFKAKANASWKAFHFNLPEAETVYAIRKGIVVEIKDGQKHEVSNNISYTSKLNEVLIEHKDGTYGRYSGFARGSITVKLGQMVYPRTQLGKLTQFNERDYRLYLMVYYLTQNIEDYKKQSLQSEDTHGYVDPWFVTEKGVVKLQDDHQYTVQLNEEVILQEFSRREKKRYKKDPVSFQ
ncbi:hypothetical protein B7P33_03650 [Sediminicola luteus]|uniref:Peptidase M23 domain-containing protein n=1 Tax=Sediminicola luteus TaxID=319238 RepID=A0A2A4GD96_9FLAO|nr:hypothetical protein B7P33_03650 [Sediminicola luteus]